MKMNVKCRTYAEHSSATVPVEHCATRANMLLRKHLPIRVYCYLLLYRYLALVARTTMHYTARDFSQGLSSG